LLGGYKMKADSEEVQVARQELAAAIAQLLADFTRRTGLVADVVVDTWWLTDSSIFDGYRVTVETKELPHD
jgi:hypothetical protein